ncbi:MAG TPA: hypothetical protein VE978_19870 [Chitinophagales bacterium]|nr:hypothetical protein [Chitinophagales bacterium]
MDKRITKSIFTTALIFIIHFAHAQNVGVGTNAPATKLHVAGISSTLRLEGLSSALGGTHIVAAAASTDKIVYVNSNGDFKALPSGAAGQVLTLNGSSVPTWTTAATTSWLLTGNTLSATEFIGTLNVFDFIVKTNNIERMRVGSGGNIGVNVAPAGTDRLFVSDASQITTLHSLNSGTTSGSSAVRANGIAGTDAYLSYYGPITLNTTTVTNAGIYSVVTSGTSGAIVGVTSGGTGSAIYGHSTVANAGRFTNTINSSSAIVAVNQAASAANVGNGLSASTGQSSGFGALGTNVNASGTGILGAGNGGGGFYLIAGSGGAFTGTGYGSFHIGTAGTGVGVGGVGNNLSGIVGPASGSGGAFNGTALGVYSYCTTNASGNGGGYFQSGASNYAWIATRVVVTDYAINGTGVKATIVKDLNNQNVNMVCPEAPEILFEDYGAGQLVNGKAHIDLDPIFVKNVAINEKHPLRVFIQLEGDCNGVYVTNKTFSGFDVVELSGGNSNISFTYHVIANRADRKDDNGIIISYNQDNRWQPTGPLLQSQTSPQQKLQLQELPR